MEPLRVLLVAVEDERRADEPAGHELAHVAHRWAEAEREADPRLQPFAPREIARALRIPKVVRDRLLAEDVLAGLERRPRELEMRVARRADVDEIDVAAPNQLHRVGGRMRDVELAGGVTCAVEQRVCNPDDLTARIAPIPREMSAARPRARPEYADTHESLRRHGRSLTRDGLPSGDRVDAPPGPGPTR